MAKDRIERDELASKLEEMVADFIMESEIRQQIGRRRANGPARAQRLEGRHAEDSQGGMAAL